MIHPYWVQPLRAPFKNKKDQEVDDVFGSRVNMAKEGKELIGQVCSFTPMHAFEYEQELAPSLSKFAASAVAMGKTVLHLSGNEIKPNYERHVRLRRKRIKPGMKDLPAPREVHILCRGKDCAEVQSYIRQLALGLATTKRECGFTAALDPSDDVFNDDRTCGWYAIDGEFFFFTDPAMANKMAELFGVTAQLK